MCKNNRDGELPSCIEAKFNGPGCEEWDLCFQCADTLKAERDKLLLQLNEAKETAAKIVEAHKSVCRRFHDDCCAQVAAEIRGYIEKRNCEHIWNGYQCYRCGIGIEKVRGTGL